MAKIELTIENSELVKKASVEKGVSMQSLVNNIISDFGIADKTQKVILSIPTSLTKRNKENLQKWLQLRVEAVVNAYYGEK